jgi:hypothetical protein
MNSRLGKRNVRLRGPLVPHAGLCTPSAPVQLKLREFAGFSLMQPRLIRTRIYSDDFPVGSERAERVEHVRSVRARILAR